jgi:hypothetical protein
LVSEEQHLFGFLWLSSTLAFQLLSGSEPNAINYFTFDNTPVLATIATDPIMKLVK